MGAETETTTDAGYSTLLTRVGQANHETLFADGGEVRTWARTTFERSRSPFDVGSLTVRPGEYRFEDVGLELFLNAFVQYNGETNTWLSNIRYNLIHRPLSDFYIVWNETHAPGAMRRALLLKFTHMLAF